jgi:hypothetical protein
MAVQGGTTESPYPEGAQVAVSAAGEVGSVPPVETGVCNGFAAEGYPDAPFHGVANGSRKCGKV